MLTFFGFGFVFYFLFSFFISDANWMKTVTGVGSVYGVCTKYYTYL